MGVPYRAIDYLEDVVDSGLFVTLDTETQDRLLQGVGGPEQWKLKTGRAWTGKRLIPIGANPAMTVLQTIKDIFIGESHLAPTLKKAWHCDHCGRLNWLDRLTCEGCGAPRREW